MNDNEKMIIDSIINNTDTMFNVTDDEEAVYNSINGHFNFLKENIGQFVTFEDASFSWMENIYLPLHNALMNSPYTIGFPKKKIDKLFFEVCDNWYFMAQKDENTMASDAVINYFKNFSNRAGRLFIKAYSVA